MSSPTEKIIHEVIAGLRQDQAKQEEACLQAIKEVQATDQSSSRLGEQNVVAPVKGLIGKGPGAIAKYSFIGEFIGWYRNGQASGLPNQRMPIEIDLDEQFEAYYAMLRSVVPPEVLAAQLGRRSGESRAENGLQPDIKSLHTALLGTSVPKHHRAKVIAKTLNCNVEYVRRTLRNID